MWSGGGSSGTPFPPVSTRQKPIFGPHTLKPGFCRVETGGSGGSNTFHFGGPWGCFKGCFYEKTGFRADQEATCRLDDVFSDYLRWPRGNLLLGRRKKNFFRPTGNLPVGRRPGPQGEVAVWQPGSLKQKSKKPMGNLPIAPHPSNWEVAGCPPPLPIGNFADLKWTNRTYDFKRSVVLS